MSSQLNSVFDAKNSYWFASASLTQPIFSGGRIRNNYRLSVAQQQEMVLAYRNTILNALKDVSNSLVAYQETRGHRVELAAQVESAADAVRLARLRYSGGNTSYLEVLTTDTDHGSSVRPLGPVPSLVNKRVGRILWVPSRTGVVAPLSKLEKADGWVRV